MSYKRNLVSCRLLHLARPEIGILLSYIRVCTRIYLKTRASVYPCSAAPNILTNSAHWASMASRSALDMRPSSTNAGTSSDPSGSLPTAARAASVTRATLSGVSTSFRYLSRETLGIDSAAFVMTSLDRGWGALSFVTRIVAPDGMYLTVEHHLICVGRGYKTPVRLVTYCVLITYILAVGESNPILAL